MLSLKSFRFANKWIYTRKGGLLSISHRVLFAISQCGWRILLNFDRKTINYWSGSKTNWGGNMIAAASFKNRTNTTQLQYFISLEAESLNWAYLYFPVPKKTCRNVRQFFLSLRWFSPSPTYQQLRGFQAVLAIGKGPWRYVNNVAIIITFSV